MAGTTVDYIVRLLRDDSDLKKQLKATGRDISKLNAHERAEIKATLQTRMDALAATAKAAHKNTDSLSMIDMDGLKDEMTFIKEVFKEMKALNPAEDWAKSGKVFAQTFSNMHQQLGDLAGVVESLKSDVVELGESFKNIGFDIVPTVDVSNVTKQATRAVNGIGDVVVNRVHNVSKTVQREYNKANKFLADLNANRVSSQNFKSLDDVNKKLRSLYSSFDFNYSRSADDEAAKYAKEIFDTIKYAEKTYKTFSGQSIFKDSQLEEMQSVIDAQMAYAHKQIEIYNDEVQKAFELNLADKLTKNLKNLNLSIELPKQADFVKKINSYIDSVNAKKLHTIKVGIDDSFNLNKKNKKNTNKKNNTDQIPVGQENNKALEQTIDEKEIDDVISTSGLAKFEAAIDKMQKSVKTKTSKWRGEMTKMLKFTGDDFEFNFGNTLMDNLQNYFYEPGHELDIIINEDELKRRIENVVKESGGVIGSSGGTATFDPKMMASAVYSAIQAAFTGKELPTFDFGNTVETEEVSEATDEVTESHKKYVKTLDESTIHIDKVIQSLQKFASIAPNSKAGRAIDTWFNDFGIDMSLIRAGAVDDSEIRSMLQEAWMSEDNMGHATGSTVVDRIEKFFEHYKSLKPDTGAGKALTVLKQDIIELFKMLEIPLETINEWQDRTQKLQIYEDAAKYGRGLALLNKFRPKLHPGTKNNAGQWKRNPQKAMTENATAEDLRQIRIDDIDETIKYFERQQELLLIEEDELKAKIKQLKEGPATRQLEAELSKAVKDREESQARESQLQEQLKNLTDESKRNALTKELREATKYREMMVGKESSLRNKVTNLKSGHAVRALEQKLRALQTEFANFDTKPLEDLKAARISLGDSTIPEDIKAFQQVAEQFYENSKNVFEYLNKKYGNFAGDIYIQGRQNPISVQSPKDILNKIPEDAVIVDPNIYSDMGSSRVLEWDDRKSESRLLREQGRQDHQDKKEYKQDILDRDINVRGFSPLEETPSKPIKLDDRVRVLRDKVADLEQEDVDIEGEIRKLDKQIERSSNAVQKQKKLYESAGVISRNKIYTKEYEDILTTATDKNKAANIIQSALKENKGFNDVALAYNDALPKNISSDLSKLDTIVQKAHNLHSHLTYISSHSSKENIDAEIAKLGKDGQYVYNTTYDEKVNQLLKERFELYQKIKANNYDSSGIIGGLSVELTKLQSRETSLKSTVSTWSQSTIDKNERQMQTAQNKLKPLIQVFRTEINGLVDEIIDIASKLNNPNLKGKARDDMVVKLQNRLQLLQEAEDEYADFRTKVGNSPESLLTKARKKSVDGLYEQYITNTPSILGARKEKLDELQESDLKLRTNRSDLESKKKANEVEREAAQHRVVRLEKQLEYNKLKEQELKLQEQIAALEDGQEKDTKATELGNLQIKLASLEKEIGSLGGFVTAGDDKVYTQEDKKKHALKYAKQSQLDLITAHEQKRAIKSSVDDIEKWENQVNKYGLKVGYGDRAYSQYKQRLVEEFRAQTRAALKEQLGLNDAKFQVEPTMMSEEVYNLKQQLYETLETQTKEIVNKYRESIHINEKGMLEATEFRFDAEAQEIVESTQIVRDVKQHILNDLKNRKDIITGKKALVDGNLVDTGEDRVKQLDELIQYIKTERDKALSYGGLEYDDIKNDDIIEEQILFQQQIDTLMRKKASVEADESKDEKTKEKELALLNQEIQDYQRLIFNREKLIELRAKEKEESKWSTEEKQIYYTDQLIKSKERLKQVNGEISTLEKAMNDAIAQHGKGSAEAVAAQYAYDNKVEYRKSLLEIMANANKKLGYVNQHLGQNVVTTSNETKQGGIFGGLISAIQEGLSGISVGTIDVDNSDIATETTLRAIFEMLSGGGQASADLDEEKARGKAERDAKRKEEQARVIAESKIKKAEADVVKEESKKQSKTAKAKAQLSVEGQAKFKAIQAEGRKAYSEIANADEKTIIQKIKAKVGQFKNLTKDTEEYLQAQYEFFNMIFAYTSKLQASGVTSKTKKNGDKYLDYKDVLDRSEIKSLGDVKSLVLPAAKDIADGLIKLGFGAKLGSNKKTTDINKLDDKILVDRFRHLMQLLSENKATDAQQSELNKIIDILKDRGVYKGSKQETAESEQQLENEKAKTAETQKQVENEKKATATSSESKVESSVDNDAYRTAVETVRSAIGDFDMRSSKTAKAEKYASLGQEVKDAGNLIFKNLENATREEKALVDKLIKLRDIRVQANEQAKAPIETKTESASTDEHSKEQVLEAFQNLLQTQKNLSEHIAALENQKDPSKQAEKVALQQEYDELTPLVTKLHNELSYTNEDDSSEKANQVVVDAINNVGEKVDADKTTEITSNITDNQSTDRTTAQGGIFGAINNLAKESTLAKVLTALGEIAKKNALAGAGKQNSAQDLLEQFRRMLESDAWEGRERVAYVDLATGSMSNSITGDDKSISSERLSILRSAYKDVMDFNAQVHTHANEDDPYFSQDDLKLFASDFADGITKQILLSKNNMTVLDMTNVKDVEGLLDALAKTEHSFEALASTADKFGAKYVNRAFNEITPQGLVKMLGIKGIESKYTETETRDSAVQGMLEEDAKVAADMLQESTGRAVKKTVEHAGAELMTVTEKTDAKGNKTWSNQISDKYTKAAIATNKAFKSLELEKEFGIGTDAQLALVDYTNKYEEFLRLTEEFKKNPKQEGLQAQFDKLLPELDAAKEKLNKLIISKDKFLNGKEAIKIFEGADLANAGDSLKSLATARYTQNALNPGDNIAFNGISETPNGTRLLVDVLKDGTIRQYALEVDRATGQVKEFMVAETALANAFQNVNKAMRYNETVMASVAVGDTPAEQAAFMNDANSFGLAAYKEAMASMEQYVADIWNRMANGGESASKEELDYIMALSERVIALGKNVQKTSIDFKNFWAQNPDNVVGHIIYHQGYNRDDRVREELEGKAKIYASANNAEYGFSSFDNDTLQFTLTDAEGKISKVTYQWNELYQQIAMVSDKATSAIDPMVAKIERYDEALQEAVKNGYLMAEDKNFDAFYTATDGIRSLVYGIENGYETFDTVKDKLYELRQEALKYGDLAKKTATQNKRLFVGTGAKKQVDNQYNKIFGVRQASGAEFEAQFSDDSPLFKTYIDAYEHLNNNYQKYVDNHSLNNPKIQQEIQQQAAQVQLLGRKYLSSVTQAEKLKDLVEQSGSYKDSRTGEEKSLGGSTNVTAEEVANLEAKMNDFVQNGLRQANIEGVKFDAVNQKLTYTFRTSKNTVADMVVQYNDATKALYAYQKQERESLTGFAGFMQSMKGKMKSILQYTTSITSIYRVWGELKRGVQYIKEIDSALTELKKVTDETEETYDRFLKTAAKTADKVGSTIKEVVSSAADWARLGYSLEDAATLAETTSVLLNVSEFKSIEDATSALTSTLQAFSMTADTSMDAVDVLNEIGKLVAYR